MLRLSSAREVCDWRWRRARRIWAASRSVGVGREGCGDEVGSDFEEEEEEEEETLGFVEVFVDVRLKGPDVSGLEGLYANWWVGGGGSS